MNSLSPPFGLALAESLSIRKLADDLGMPNLTLRG